MNSNETKSIDISDIGIHCHKWTLTEFWYIVWDY